MKVFIDTNVLISAFMTRGLASDLYRLLLAEHDAMTGTVNVEEFRDILDRKFKVSPADARYAVEQLRDLRTIDEPSELPDIKVRDPDDLVVLASAIDAAADVLVTGDRDLLSIRRKLPVEILNPRDCWELLRGSKA